MAEAADELEAIQAQFQTELTIKDISGQTEFCFQWELLILRLFPSEGYPATRVRVAIDSQVLSKSVLADVDNTANTMVAFASQLTVRSAGVFRSRGKELLLVEHCCLCLVDDGQLARSYTTCCRPVCLYLHLNIVVGRSTCAQAVRTPNSSRGSYCKCALVLHCTCRYCSSECCLISGRQSKHAQQPICSVPSTTSSSFR